MGSGPGTGEGPGGTGVGSGPGTGFGRSSLIVNSFSDRLNEFPLPNLRTALDVELLRRFVQRGARAVFERVARTAAALP